MSVERQDTRAEAADTEAVLRGRQIHDEWRALYRRTEVEELQRSYLEEVVERLQLKPGMTILDAGCGTAFNAVRLAEMGLTVDGVDLSDDAIEQGRRYAASRGVADRVRLRQGDITALDLADGSFDAVLCLGVLMHVPDFAAALGELARVLRPGGALVLYEGNAYSPENIAQRAYWRLAKRKGIRVESDAVQVCSWLPSPGGRFLVRNVSLAWLAERLEEAGLKLEWSRTGDLTELYARRWVPFQKGLIALNRLWFKARAPAWLASGFFVGSRKL